ncbi:MAG TPA: hypothetical protein VEH09_08355 [Thermodesulfobacteriota bacterium]|nr:hypothetical protein [Thermodesulfobacteriota bacterium]
MKVDRKKVENLISIGKKLGTHDIRDLALIKTNGGDPNQHLQTLHMNLGQEESFLPAERRVDNSF